MFSWEHTHFLPVHAWLCTRVIFAGSWRARVRPRA